MLIPSGPSIPYYFASVQNNIQESKLETRNIVKQSTTKTETPTHSKQHVTGVNHPTSDTGVGTPQAQPMAEAGGHQGVQGRQRSA